MSEAISKLHAWLSPAYPVGAFSYSHGLETAVADGSVWNPATLADWVSDCLVHGAGRTDAILLSHAWRAPDDDGVAELAAALAPSGERLLETEAQGAAFASVTSAAWGGDLAPAPYPVAVGRAAAAHGVPLLDCAALYLQAVVANLVGAGVRLVPIGQTDGQRIVAHLAPRCWAVAKEASLADLDALGGCAVAADIASMRHETQPVRLFRS